MRNFEFAFISSSWGSRWQGLSKMKFATYFMAICIGLSGFAMAAPPVVMAFNPSNTDATFITSDALHLKIVAAGSYHLDASGVISIINGVNGDISPQIPLAASTNNIKLFPTIVNCCSPTGANFDADTAGALMVPGNAQNTAISNIVALSQTNGFSGVDLDFEVWSVPSQFQDASHFRDAYTAFVSTLATQLHNINKTLTVSLPAPKDKYYYLNPYYDYAALAVIADILQIMTYDENGASPSEIGPVAGLDWVSNNFNYLIQTLHVPVSKLSMGIPIYGYDWNLTTPAKPTMKSWSDIPNLPTLNNVKSYDTATSSPYLTYSVLNGGTTESHKVYYENTTSIRAKAALAASLGLASVSVFALGKDSTDFWPALMAGLNQTAVSIGSINYLLNP